MKQFQIHLPSTSWTQAQDLESTSDRHRSSAKNAFPLHQRHRNHCHWWSKRRRYIQSLKQHNVNSTCLKSRSYRSIYIDIKPLPSTRTPKDLGSLEPEMTCWSIIRLSSRASFERSLKAWEEQAPGSLTSIAKRPTLLPWNSCMTQKSGFSFEHVSLPSLAECELLLKGILPADLITFLVRKWISKRTIIVT